MFFWPNKRVDKFQKKRRGLRGLDVIICVIILDFYTKTSRNNFYLKEQLFLPFTLDNTAEADLILILEN